MRINAIPRHPFHVREYARENQPTHQSIAINQQRAMNLPGTKLRRLGSIQS